MMNEFNSGDDNCHELTELCNTKVDVNIESTDRKVEVSHGFCGSKIKDPYFATKILLCWLIIVMVIFASCGLFEGAFFGFGPGPNVILFGIVIDTWTKWSVVVLINFVDMAIVEWGMEIIKPYITNVIQDPKTVEIDRSKASIYFIVNGSEICANIRSVIYVNTVLTQIDFVLAALVGNLISMNITTWSYLRPKKFV